MKEEKVKVLKGFVVKGYLRDIRIKHSGTRVGGVGNGDLLGNET